MHKCPICEYGLDFDPAKLDYSICEQCGVEFGYDEIEHYSKIRAAWIKAGRPFWFTSKSWQEELNRVSTY